MPPPEESKEAKRENGTDKELNTPGIGQQKQCSALGLGLGLAPEFNVQRHTYIINTRTHTPSKVSQAMDGQCV